MPRSLSSIEDPKKKIITFRTALLADILPWGLAAVFITLLYFGIVLIAAEVINTQDNAFEIAAATASQQILLIYSLIIIACMIARRAIKDIPTWILAFTLIILFAPPLYGNYAAQIFPNSVLPAMVAMISILAIWRLIEFIYTRYVAKLDEYRMSASAWILYCMVIIGTIALSLPIL